MLKGNKKRCTLPERGFKPLKALLKIPKSRCTDLERRDTSLLITKMARDFRNKIDHSSRICILKDFKG